MLPRNDAELKAMLMKPLKVATQYVVDKILEEIKNANQEVVYDAFRPWIYDRRMELINNWTSEVVASNGEAIGVVESEPTYGWSVVTGELVSNLHEIVYEGLAGHIFGEGPWTKKRDAWKVIEKVCGKKNIKKWYGEGLRHAGLNIKNKRGGVTKL